MAVRIPMVVKRGGATPSAGWVRPADWLAIPEIAAGEEVVYILQSVLDVVGNFAAVKFGGDYTVDWGDGTIENVASGVKAEHQYAWADVGDVTSEGFRQALIKVTPQAGSNITSVDLQEYHSVIGDDASSQFIDLVMNIPNVSGANLVIGGITIYHRMIERVWIKEIGAVTDMYYMFRDCNSLQSVPLFDTSSVTDMRNMFDACYSLQRNQMTGTKVSFDMSDSIMSAAAIDELGGNVADLTGETSRR